MSFLNEIVQKKTKLKSNETKITTSSGHVYKEYTTPSGETIQIKINETSPGFIIDEKPDKQIGKILPWLYLGSQDVANDEELIRENNITHILSLGVMPIQFNFIQYKFLLIYDEPNYNITQHFIECFKFINDCKINSNVVYVHCNAGVSRSSTIVIAYIMKHLCIDFNKAYDLVKQKRSCVKPNEGFIKLLKLYEKEIKIDSE